MKHLCGRNEFNYWFGIGTPELLREWNRIGKILALTHHGFGKVAAPTSCQIFKHHLGAVNGLTNEDPRRSLSALRRHQPSSAPTTIQLREHCPYRLFSGRGVLKRSGR